MKIVLDIAHICHLQQEIIFFVSYDIILFSENERFIFLQ